MDIYSKSRQIESEYNILKNEAKITLAAINLFKKENNIDNRGDSSAVTLIEELKIYKQKYDLRLIKYSNLSDKENTFIAFLNRAIYLDGEEKRLDVLNRENKINIEVYEEAIKKNINTKLIKICYVMGLLFSMLGFIYWYYRIQKYEDYLLQLNSKYTETKRDIAWFYGLQILAMVLFIYWMFTI